MAVPETYNKAVAITPGDTSANNVTGLVPRAFYCGGTGNVAVVMPNDSVVNFIGVQVGWTIYVSFKRINATNTTATNLVALGVQ
jgi:hypothetical protein